MCHFKLTGHCIQFYTFSLPVESPFIFFLDQICIEQVILIINKCRFIVGSFNGFIFNVLKYF